MKLFESSRFYFGLTMIGIVVDLFIGIAGFLNVAFKADPILITVSWVMRHVHISLDTLVLYGALGVSSKRGEFLHEKNGGGWAGREAGGCGGVREYQHIFPQPVLTDCEHEKYNDPFSLRVKGSSARTFVDVGSPFFILSILSTGKRVGGEYHAVPRIVITAFASLREEALQAVRYIRKVRLGLMGFGWVGVQKEDQHGDASLIYHPL